MGQIYRQNQGNAASTSKPSTDPYAIAAYLRLWHNVWESYQAGNTPENMHHFLFDSTGEHPWDPCAPPRFNIVIRSTNREGIDIDGNNIGLIKRTYSGNVSTGQWGCNSYKVNAAGQARVWDKWRDWGSTKAPLEKPDGMKKHNRDSGSPGMLFLGFVDNACIDSEPNDPAASGHESYHKPAIGLAIPKGGPVYKSMI
jgi:hypothetical protein